MEYYLAPWEWYDGPDDVPHFRSPFKNTRGLIDLRSLSDQEVPTHDAGFGLFVATEKQTVPGSIYLGDNLAALVDKRQLKSVMGLGENIVASELGPVIWELVTVLADPVGTVRVRPLTPTHTGIMELHLAEDVVVRKRILETDPEWPNIRLRIQDNYKKIKAGVDAKHYPAGQHLRALSVWQKKYRIEDYTKFIPPGFADEGTALPATNVADLFARANENLEDSANWSLIGQAAGETSLAVVSEQCRPDSIAHNNSTGQHQTALSTDDHFSQVTVESLTAPGSTRNSCGAACRVSINAGSAINSYQYEATIDSGSTVRGRLSKFTGAGATAGFTALRDEVETINLTDTIRCEADGSNITGKINGTITAAPFSDGSHSGDLNVGLDGRIEQGAVGDIDMDNFAGGDLVAAAGQGAGSLGSIGVGW